MAGWLTGIISGIGKQASSYREQGRKDQADQDAREERILATLAASDDHEISSAATTAMLDIASGGKKPKGGFLQNLMGPARATTHPAVDQLLKMVREPVQERVGDIPMRGITMIPPPAMPQPKVAPPGAQPAAMAPPPGQGGPPQVLPGTPPPQQTPQGAPRGVQVGTPPPILPVPNGPDSSLPVGVGLNFQGPVVGTAPGTTQPVPRKLFDTPEEKQLKASRAKSQGDVEGEVAGLIAAGFSDQEARALIKEKYERATRGDSSSFRPLEWEAPNAQGQYEPIGVTFNNRTGEYETTNGLTLPTGARPRSQSASTMRGNAGVDTPDSISLLKFGMSYGDPRMTIPMRVVVDSELKQRRNVTNPFSQSYNREAGGAQAAAVRPFSVQEVFSNENELRNNLYRYTEAAQRTVQMGEVINQAKAQIDTKLIEGAPIGAQSEALISAFKRITDELSAVRNEEYDRSAQNQSFFNRIDGWWTRVTQGGAGVAKAEIDNIVQMANAIVEGRRERIKNEALTTYRAGQERQFKPERFMSPQMLELIGVTGGAAGGGSMLPGGAPPGSSAASSTPQVSQVVGNELPRGVVPKRVPDPDNPAQMIYIAQLPNGQHVEVVFRDGKYFIK